MATVLPPANSELVGSGSAPDNATFRAGIDKFLNFAKNLLGTAGTPAAARTALELPSNTTVNYALNTDYNINQRNVLVGVFSGSAGFFYRDCWYGGASGFTLLIGNGAGDLNQKMYLPVDPNGRTYTMSWTGPNVVRKDGVVVTSPTTFTHTGAAAVVITQEFTAATGRTLISKLLIEPGPNATLWPNPDTVPELLRCQQFCYPFDENLGNAITAANVGSSNVRFPVPMVSVPTIEGTATFTASAGSNGTPNQYTGPGVPASKKQVFMTNGANNWTVGSQVRLTAVFVAA